MNYSINIENAQVKICISKPKPAKQIGRRRAVIRVNEEVYDELAELSNSIGITICELASNMIKFAREKTAMTVEAPCYNCIVMSRIFLFFMRAKSRLPSFTFLINIQLLSVHIRSDRQ